MLKQKLEVGYSRYNMKIQYILHADFERPGILEVWAEENHYEQRFCRPFRGEKLLSLDPFDLLILMGGPQSPLEIEKDPYLNEEIGLIRRAINRKMPVLGFCLGAQLIGEALGAKTERGPHKEVGVFPIQLTQEGIKDPLFEGTAHQFPVVHWHSDMPGLTREAKVLAYSEGCPRQVIRYVPSVYGFQCHPEPMRANIEAMIAHCPDDLAPGKFVQSAKALLTHDFDSINQVMIRFINLFVARFTPNPLLL